MEYTINKLAKMAGVSTRTLRYYCEIGLLKPNRTNSAGYRIYGKNEVDKLQQILFYRELDISLENIKQILSSADFDRKSALESHLMKLIIKQKQLNLLIANVEKTIAAIKGEENMSDQEKFKGFSSKMIDDNEQQYGTEIRAKYGDEAIDLSNAKVRRMSKKEYEEIERLSREFNETLKAAFEQGDPANKLAQKACELHKKWLCYYWDHYSKEAHIGLVQMYVDDPRFTAYYDKIAYGCAPFLRDAMLIYCK